jgi:hypothetical protein
MPRAGLVPQDLQVERVEQAGFEAGVQTRQDVSGQRELIEQGGVGCFGGRLLQGVELGLGLLALVVELGEPLGDARDVTIVPRGQAAGRQARSPQAHRHDYVLSRRGWAVRDGQGR